MGSNFLQQFMAGWQMGQDRVQNQRRDQMLQYKAEQDALDRQLQQEQLKLQKDKIRQQEREMKINEGLTAQQAIRERLGMLQSQPTPIQQMAPGLQGPPAEDPNARAPIPIPGIPELGIGSTQVMPQYREDVLANERGKTDLESAQRIDLERQLLGAREPFQIRDDERTAKLYAQRDAAAESRAEARYKRQTGSINKQADALRKEYNSQIKPYLPQLDNFNKASALAAKPDEARTAADDMALVFIFMRSLDPGSTVREGEYATAKNTAGVPDRIRNAYNATLNGKFLSPDQRKGFAAAIERDFSAGPGKAISTIQNRYRYLGQQTGIDNPDQMILMDIGGEPVAPSGGDYETTSVPGVRRRRIQR